MIHICLKGYESTSKSSRRPIGSKFNPILHLASRMWMFEPVENFRSLTTRREKKVRTGRTFYHAQPIEFRLDSTLEYFLY